MADLSIAESKLNYNRKTTINLFFSEICSKTNYRRIIKTFDRGDFTIDTSKRTPAEDI
jgi:hypothetical protein